MLTRQDVQRIEAINDCIFERGKDTGEVIKKCSTKIARGIAIVSIIIFIGAIMFISGMFSSKDDKPLQPINNK